MLRLGRKDVILLIICIGFFISWNMGFSDDDWMQTLGTLSLQLAIGVLTLYWTVTAFLSISSQKRYFWLLISMGVFFYSASNIIWVCELVTDNAVSFSDASYIIWLVAYVFFLSALLFITRVLSKNYSNSPFAFNIAIFLVTALSVIVHYLVNPILTLDESLLIKGVSLSYPTVSMGILCASTFLYYLLQVSKEKSISLFVIIGFFLQFIADSLYAYASFAGGYQAGTIIDFLWMLSLLTIGFGGEHARENLNGAEWEIHDPFEKRDTIFPYLSIILLIGLVIYSYRWDFNALSMGLLIVFLMMLGRQLFVLRKNKEIMSKYKYLAFHDPLTGLNNRSVFIEDLTKLMRKADQCNNSVALFLLDLDRFKNVNDTLGHDIGDQLLIMTADRIKKRLGESSFIYRLGGDEFLVIFPEATVNKCKAVADEILREFTSPFLIAEYEINITPSIGISMYPDNSLKAEDILKYADASMYLAKKNGKNGYSFYTSDMKDNLTRKVMIENGIRKAIDNNELKLFYQPKVDLKTSEIIGMEALLRWEHPEYGFISPMEFIPVAEEIGEIVSIGKWVLKEACSHNKRWQEKGYPPLTVSINVSVRQLQHRNFVKVVEEVLLETGLSPQYLELEITESIMQNIKESTVILSQLRRRGIKIAIDDFGTGYSSLYILNKLPVDIIKIDKSFIDNIEEIGQQSMVKAIIDLGINLNFEVIAEGIEHEHQKDALLQNRCYLGQGYLFSKPISTIEFEKEILEKMAANKVLEIS